MITPTFTPSSPTASAGEAGVSLLNPTPTPEIKAVYLSEVYPYPNENETEWVELLMTMHFQYF